MNAKMTCLWKPAQSGKTRTIMEMIRANEEVATHLNVVICSNIRLLVSQTAARMTRELYTGSDTDSDVSDAESADDRIDGDVFSWMSGTTRTNISVRELADRVKEEEVNMVVCCSHKARFRYLMELLGNLERSKHFNKPISVWIDEADVSVKTWSAPEYDFTRFTKVARLCLVSATFNSVVKTYGRIKVLGFESTFPDCYLPLEECQVVEHEGVADVVANLATVLDQRPELCAPGVRLFAPGMLEVATHDGIAEYLKTKGFAVMVLNGQRKCIICPDNTIIPLSLRMDPSTPDEIGKVLPGLYATHGLARWPFAVTGQMCLGRGITFQSSEFLFDYGVLPNLGDPAAAYQCVARLLGNVKHLEGFQAPTVFMDKEMVTMTRVQEKLASNVAKLVLEKGWTDVGPEELEFVLHGNEERYVADVRETDTHVNRNGYVRKHKEFVSAEAARDYYEQVFGTTDGFASRPHRDEATGKFVCSFSNVKSSVCPIDVVRSRLATGNLWGETLKKLDANQYSRIGTLKIGYDGETAVFVLCVCSKTEFDWPDHPIAD